MLVAVFLFSALINILYLTGSIFMLQVYDRVIPSRNLPTLAGLCILAAGLYGGQALLDIIRARVFVRLAHAFDRSVSPQIFDATLALPLGAPRVGDGLQAIRDVGAIRGFLASGGPAVLMDLPWLPLFLAICFLFHFLIGLTATVGAVILLCIAVAGEMLTRNPVKQATLYNARQLSWAGAGQRNAEMLAAMGMVTEARRRWLSLEEKQIVFHSRIADITGEFSALSKALRYMLQSAVLAVGAYLVVNQQATGGIIIASSIVTARALAPVELVISQWKSAIAARQSWARLKALAKVLPPQGERLVLPPPSRFLIVDNLSVRAPGSQKLTVSGAKFTLKAGEAVGVIGLSGSGKSTLARALAGVWTAAQGAVRLDGAQIDQWDRERLGRHIGYLPQEAELFSGTIAENIGRLASPIESSAILQAAKAAGVHEMILDFENGYESQVGDSGALLSSGQRQRIALARALYKEPFLVILDEPNSNLDQEGDAALTEAIRGVKARGGIVVVVSHRPSVISAVDYVLMMREGRMQTFGPKEEVLGRVLTKPPAQSPVATNVAGFAAASPIRGAAT